MSKNFIYFIFTIILLFTIYWAYIFTRNIFLEKAEAIIIGTQFSSEIYYRNPNRYSYGAKPTTHIHYYPKTLYKYEVNGKVYEKSKKSNVIIFKNNLDGKHDGDKIIVYYCKIFNGYSILFKCNFKYFLINSIPLYAVLFFAFYYFKKNYFTEVKTTEIIKTYFSNLL